MVIIDGEEYLTGGEAAKYLAERWGLPSYSTTAFRMLRFRHKELKPDISLPSNASLWKPSTLDTIPKPDRSKPWEERKQDEDTEKRDAVNKRPKAA